MSPSQATKQSVMQKDLIAIKKNLFAIPHSKFTQWAREIYRYQLKNTAVFNNWTRHVQAVTPDKGQYISENETLFNPREFTFLPIEFFKTHSVLNSQCKVLEATFESSGTRNHIRSKHMVYDLSIYEQSFTQGFEMQYGRIEQYCVIGLLPSYIEREGSSLIYMVDKMIQKGKPKSGFYLDQYHDLAKIIDSNEKNEIPTLLFGVAFSLLSMAEIIQNRLWTRTIIMETGGMKGRGNELTRNELHRILSTSFGCKNIHSEYGMTEMLSQAYAPKEGIFFGPPWMKIVIQDPVDFRTFLSPGKTGRICVIDLANIHSCSFIATDDLGRVWEDGSFEMLGRIDFTDLRGCNQLI